MFLFDFLSFKFQHGSLCKACVLLSFYMKYWGTKYLNSHRTSKINKIFVWLSLALVHKLPLYTFFHASFAVQTVSSTMTRITSQRAAWIAVQWTLPTETVTCQTEACTAAPAWAPSIVPRILSHPRPCPPTSASLAVSSCGLTTSPATVTVPSLHHPIGPRLSTMLSCGRSGACSLLTMTFTASRYAVSTSAMPVPTGSLSL